MARFDVFERQGEPGYLLDCQADILSQLTTRFVVPLLSPDRAPHPAERLNPTFEVAGAPMVMVTQFAAAVPMREIGEVTTSLDDQHITIMNALDMLLTGY